MCLKEYSRWGQRSVCSRSSRVSARPNDTPSFRRSFDRPAGQMENTWRRFDRTICKSRVESTTRRLVCTGQRCSYASGRTCHEHFFFNLWMKWVGDKRMQDLKEFTCWIRWYQGSRLCRRVHEVKWCLWIHPCDPTVVVSLSTTKIRKTINIYIDLSKWSELKYEFLIRH